NRNVCHYGTDCCDVEHKSVSHIRPAVSPPKFGRSMRNRALGDGVVRAVHDVSDGEAVWVVALPDVAKGRRYSLERDPLGAFAARHADVVRLSAGAPAGASA